MKYTFLAHTIAFVLLSTIVTFTHCCSSRRMPQRRPPSSSTIIRTHDPRILNHPRGEEDVLSSSKSARLPNSSSKTTPSVTFTDKQLPSVHKILPSSSSSSARPSVAPGVASVTTSSSSTSSSSTTTSTSSTNDNINSSRPSGASTITLNDSNCTSAYRKHYCLNNGICFNYTIQQNFTLLSCLCADGFYGERCEDKYLEGSYSTKMRSNKHIMLHVASIQYGLVASLAVVIVVFYVKIYVTAKCRKLTTTKIMMNTFTAAATTPNFNKNNNNKYKRLDRNRCYSTKQ